VHTSQQASTREVCWRILPVITPRVLRHCSHCGTTRQFACSDTFRVNANQRKIDVWLIYRCVDCDCTWNRTIFTRSTPEEIGPVLYRHFQDNHRETAWHYTFDLAQLHHLGVRCDATVPVRVERFPRDEPSTDKDGQIIRLELPYPCEVRLDKLLAGELGVSRSCLQRWGDQGLIRVWPADKAALRKPIKNGQVVTIFPAEQQSLISTELP
jgi:hypothetical protein